MKSTLAIVLTIASHCVALAQTRNDIYADIGCNSPGVSLTVDRSMGKRFDLGLGFSAYDLSDMQYGNRRGACYIDLRSHKAFRRNLFFWFADLGLALNGGRHPDDATIARSGLFTGVGLGYCYQINKRGMGPYASLGLDGATQSVHYNEVPGAPRKPDYGSYDATLLFSVGFKL